MLDLLQEAGASPDELTTVLELGSESARMVRAFPRGPNSEIWGLDISAEHVRWCQDHMSPPLRFATVTTAPHLPFEDGYFDLVYCGSVFTHIRELADAWILEMRRVVRKGGHIYATIHDQKTVELLLTKYRNAPGLEELVAELERLDSEASIREGGYEFFWYGADPYSNVFYDRDYLIEKWSAFGMNRRGAGGALRVIRGLSYIFRRR
jgi:ubiquinone/menaquinone biosynthesis C-methylase UbiE